MLIMLVLLGLLILLLQILLLLLLKLEGLFLKQKSIKDLILVGLKMQTSNLQELVSLISKFVIYQVTQAVEISKLSNLIVKQTLQGKNCSSIIYKAKYYFIVVKGQGQIGFKYKGKGNWRKGVIYFKIKILYQPVKYKNVVQD